MSNGQTSKALNLIHCDVWGPSRVPSFVDHLYYIAFVDDYLELAKCI